MNIIKQNKLQELVHDNNIASKAEYIWGWNTPAGKLRAKRRSEILVNLSLAERITASNFALLDKKNSTIPVPIFLEEISNNHYFIYFNLPKLSNDTYYFSVKDVKYNDVVLKKLSESKEFYLNDQNSISIYPAIFNKLNSTTLKITNHGNPINLSVNAKEINLSGNYNLKDVLNLNINIPKNINNFNIKVSYLDNFYLIPVLPYQETIVNKTQEIKPLINPSKDSILLLNSSLGTYFNDKISLTKDSSLKGPFYIKNVFGFPIYDLNFALTNDLNQIARLNASSIVKIDQNEIITQYIWLNENKNPSKLKYSGYIEIRSQSNLLASLPLEVSFLEDKSSINTTQDINKVNVSEKTSNKTTESQVKNEKQNKSLLIIFAIAIIIVVIVLLYFILKKSKEKSDYEKFLNK